jgi:hypothetical protein
MTLLEIEWQLVVPIGSRAYATFYIDGGVYFEEGPSEASGTFKVLLDEQEHIIDVSINTSSNSGGSPELRIHRAVYGDFDILAQGIGFWTKQGDGTVEFVGGYLRITSPEGKETEAIGDLLATEPQEMQFSFDWEASSEFNYDFLEAYVNDILFFRRSGLDSGTFSSTLPNEEHIFRFRYVKDSSYGEYDDCGRVRNIIVRGRNWLETGLTEWALGGDVHPVLLPSGWVQLKCSDNQSSWMERTYEPPPDMFITNIRIKYLQESQSINQLAVEAFDTFFIDALIEGFDMISESWLPVEPTFIEAELERYDAETVIFEKIADSQVFVHPDGYYRLLQKCNAPPGTYYLKTTARVGDITQIERLKIKAKVNI